LPSIIRQRDLDNFFSQKGFNIQAEILPQNSSISAILKFITTREAKEALRSLQGSKINGR
jgi:RNA recognition motif-containing protein